MFLQLIGIVVLVIAVLIVRADTNVVRGLRRAGATSRDKAVSFRTKSPLGHWRIRRLVHAGVIEERKNGRLFVRPGEWENFTRRRRKQIFAAVGLAAAVALTWFLLSRLV